jgi:hypothetical protein
VPFNGFLKTACLFLSFDLHCVAVALLWCDCLAGEFLSTFSSIIHLLV